MTTHPCELLRLFMQLGAQLLILFLSRRLLGRGSVNPSRWLSRLCVRACVRVTAAKARPSNHPHKYKHRHKHTNTSTQTQAQTQTKSVSSCLTVATAAAASVSLSSPLPPPPPDEFADAPLVPAGCDGAGADGLSPAPRSVRSACSFDDSCSFSRSSAWMRAASVALSPAVGDGKRRWRGKGRRERMCAYMCVCVCVLKRPWR